MEKGAREDLKMLLEEVLSDPDAMLHFEPLIALIGKPGVERLVNDAKQALAVTEGYEDTHRSDLFSLPNHEVGGTVRLLMERVLRDPDRAQRLADAYDTLENEGVRREEEDPYASEDQSE